MMDWGQCHADGCERTATTAVHISKPGGYTTKAYCDRHAPD